MKFLFLNLAGLAPLALSAVLMPPHVSPRRPRPQPPAQPHTPRAEQPVVEIPSGTMVGESINGVESFSAIPFADPTSGKNRLRPPVKLSTSLGTFDATNPAGACPQMLLSTDSGNIVVDVLGDILSSSVLQEAVGVTEDCLTITVQRPEGVKEGDDLPVLFWIFGGGFELGWSSMYDGTSLVNDAVERGQPFVYVAVNYRLGGFGFLAGKEVLADGASNLGLLDQRLGLEWTADNIRKFGGDPSKVTIWGESAGAMSVFDQMALYDGDAMYNGSPLFRAGIMNSGSLAPTDPVDCPKAQAVYDTVVEEAGCAGAADTLQCLRELSFDDYLQAANSVPAILSFNSVALSYLPRPDGVVLRESPDSLASKGMYAKVPFIVGDQEDEGTLFALFQRNITSTDKMVDYLSDVFFAGATKDQIRELVDTYNPFLIYGSPFRTGLFNEIYPGFKRMAALLGDMVFTLTRRVFLAGHLAVNPNVPAWSYLSSYNYGTPILGTFHASDILQVFFGVLPNFASRTIRGHYFNFLYTLDPNVRPENATELEDELMEWPRWTAEDRTLVHIFDDKGELLKDDFREDSYEVLARDVAIFRL